MTGRVSYLDCLLDVLSFQQSLEFLQIALTDNSGLEINEHCSRNMFSSSSLAEECVEGVITTADRFVRRHLAVRLDSMLEAVQFPASVTNLDTSLSDVDRDTLTLKKV